jgi:hypothetical protein
MVEFRENTLSTTGSGVKGPGTERTRIIARVQGESTRALHQSFMGVRRLMVSWRKWVILAVSVSTVVGCAGTQEPPPQAPEPMPPPARSAIEDSDLRALLRDVAAAQLCGTLEGAFSGLPGEDAGPGVEGGTAASGGRLWIRECEISARGDQLDIELGGPGWVYMNQGTSGFEVRDYLRLSAQIELTGELDLGYDRDKRIVSIWFTPRQNVVAKVAPIGEVPVRPESVLAKMASVLSAVRERAQEQAQEAVVEDGSTLFQKALQNGFTLTADLCSGQIDSMVGALGDGEIPRRPYSPDTLRWLANERVQLYPGGVDVAGPWTAKTAPLEIDVEVEEGVGVEVRAVCMEDAEGVVDAFLHKRAEPPISAKAYATLTTGNSTKLQVGDADCPITLITRVHGETEEPVKFRFRAYEVGATREAMVNCEEQTAPAPTPAPVPAPVPASVQSEQPTAPEAATPSP